MSFFLDVCTLVTSFRQSALFVMSIDQFHGCYPGDTTLSALGNATGSTPGNTSRNNSKTRQEYLKKKNLIITIIIFTNRKIYFHREYFTIIKIVIMIISKPPIKRFLGKNLTTTPNPPTFWDFFPK